MSKAGEIIGDSLARQQKQQEEARKVAQEIDAQRERDRAGGAAAAPPAVGASPSESSP